MHLACMIGHISTIKILVDSNSSLNSVDSKMKVPLQYLVETKKRVESQTTDENRVKKLEIVIEILKERGAKLSWSTTGKTKF